MKGEKKTLEANIKRIGEDMRKGNEMSEERRGVQ